MSIASIYFRFKWYRAASCDCFSFVLYILIRSFYLLLCSFHPVFPFIASTFYGQERKNSREYGTAPQPLTSSLPVLFPVIKQCMALSSSTAAGLTSLASISYRLLLFPVRCPAVSPHTFFPPALSAVPAPALPVFLSAPFPVSFPPGTSADR